ncbi:MAG: cytochrome P450 [Nocardioidaceae bacterium]
MSDLLSDLVRAQAGDDGLTDDEVLATAILLLNAGHEASVNVFGNGLVALLHAPEQYRRLAERRVPVEVAVEEMLRFDSALQLFERTATTDVDVAGVTIKAGERIGVLLGAANRDPAVFASPDELDLGRRSQSAPGFRRRCPLLSWGAARSDGTSRVTASAQLVLSATAIER